MSFAALLRRYRLSAGLTQADLAERAGLSLEAISALERGSRKRPHASTVEALTCAFGLSEPEAGQFTRIARSGSAVGPASSTAQVAAPLTPLLGRESELGRVADLLRQPTGRLISITGPPGVGKTRLSQAAVVALTAEFPDGAFFVDLSTVRDPALVLPAIGRALNLTATPARPSFDTIVEWLCGRRVLLVLDNFEQVLEATTPIVEMLMRCRDVRCLITSRTCLRVRGEQQIKLRPLRLPDAQELFVQRAEAWSDCRLSSADTDVVMAICRRLDRLPLALELAAAWIRVMSPGELLARLENRMMMLVRGPRDLASRQRTMRAALEWSVELLDPAERCLLGGLSVFVGGAPIDAVADVTGQPAFEVLAQLTGLVNASLVTRLDANGQTRINMLETIREYALELLAESGDADLIASSHALWCTHLAESSQPMLSGFDQAQWLQRLELESYNFRAALSWLARRTEVTDLCLGLRLAGALGTYWGRHGDWREGLNWIERFLPADVYAPPPVRARALLSAGRLSWRLGDRAVGRRRLDDALATYQRLNDRRAVVDVLQWLGGATVELGDAEEAVSLMEQAVAEANATGDQRLAAACLDVLGCARHDLGDHAEAMALFEQALAIRRAVGHTRGVLGTLTNLGHAAEQHGDLDAAETWLDESLRMAQQLGDVESEAIARHHLAEVAERRCQYAVAEVGYRASMTLYLRLGAVHKAVETMDSLARVAWQRGQAAIAARLQSAATVAAESAGKRRVPGKEVARSQALADIMAALGEEAFKEAWEAGTRLSPEQIASAPLGEN